MIEDRFYLHEFGGKYGSIPKSNKDHFSIVKLQCMLKKCIS